MEIALAVIHLLKQYIPFGLNNSAGIQDRWTSPASLEEVSESRYPFYHYSLRDSAGLWVFLVLVESAFLLFYSENYNFGSFNLHKILKFLLEW